MNTIKQDLAEFVQNTPIRPGTCMNFQHFVLANGTEHIRHPDPQRFFNRHGTIGQCFKNAFLLVSEFRNELLYAEGYAYKNDSQMLILHAWAVTREGKAVDPTWPDGTDYFGVPFDFEYAKNIAFGAKPFTGVIDNFRDEWPLLTGKATNWSPKVETCPSSPDVIIPPR